ncbi:MAG: helix-turn-helix domain-containing protein [Nannocystaceae bacterium]
MTLDDAEALLIRRALERHGGNVGHAAVALGLSRSALPPPASPRALVVTQPRAALGQRLAWRALALVAGPLACCIALAALPRRERAAVRSAVVVLAAVLAAIAYAALRGAIRATAAGAGEPARRPAPR